MPQWQHSSLSLCASGAPQHPAADHLKTKKAAPLPLCSNPAQACADLWDSTRLQEETAMQEEEVGQAASLLGAHDV